MEHNFSESRGTDERVFFGSRRFERSRKLTESDWARIIQGRWGRLDLAREQLAKNHAEKADLFFELKNLRRLKEIFESAKSDVACAQQIKKLWPDILPEIFRDLRGVNQAQPHEDFDPVEHTFNSLMKLNTAGLPDEDRALARAVLFWHDIGKIDDGINSEHPAISADISEQYLEQMCYSSEQIERLLLHIRWHDALGELSRRDGRNNLQPRVLSRLFPTLRELKLHLAVIKADINSIPGLQACWPEILSIYEIWKRKLEAGQKFLEVPETTPTPFYKICKEEVIKITQDFYYSFSDLNDECSKLAGTNCEENGYLGFGIIDQYLGMDRFNQLCQSKFQKLPLQQRGLVEKTLIQLSLDINSEGSSDFPVGR